MLSNVISKNREKLNKDLSVCEERKFFSPGTYWEYLLTVPAIVEFAHGNCIDIGCGDMPFKSIVLGKVSQYDTLDIERRIPEVKYLGNILNMDMISDNAYDSVLCIEVLEHVRDPFLAISEVSRIVKKKGHIILSVPHLSRLHEEPNDYFRYTKHGLQYLLKNAGFRVLRIEPGGGIFSFLGHQFSSIFVCLFWHVPIVRNIVFFMNKWLCVMPCYFLDKNIDKKKIFTLGYTCVAEKI